MKKVSYLDKCRVIYMREIADNTVKVSAAERKRIVALFVTEGGAKENSANVYFTHIKNSLKPTPAPVTKTPAPLDLSYLNEDDVDPSSQNDFEKDFAVSLNTSDEELV